MSACGEAHAKMQHASPPFSEVTKDKLTAQESSPLKGRKVKGLASSAETFWRTFLQSATTR